MKLISLQIFEIVLIYLVWFSVAAIHKIDKIDKIDEINSNDISSIPLAFHRIPLNQRPCDWGTIRVYGECLPISDF